MTFIIQVVAGCFGWSDGLILAGDWVLLVSC